jgi:hypothetical protein
VRKAKQNLRGIFTETEDRERYITLKMMKISGN